MTLNEKEKGSHIEDVFQQLLKSKKLGEIIKIIPQLLEYFTQFGESNFRLNVWTRMDMEQKEKFVHALFNFLIECNSLDKLIVLDLLEVLYIDAEASVRDKLLYIFYAALNEKHNYKLALAALSFFVYLWNKTPEDDPLRGDIFPKLLDFIDNKDTTLLEEGLFETIKLLEDATPRQREETLERLMILAETQSDPEAQYAIFEALKEVVDLYLADFEDWTPDQLTSRSLQLLQKTQHLKHPKPVFSLLRFIFGNKLTLTEDAEKIIFELLTKLFKKITFDFMGSFWQAVYDFLQSASYIPKTSIIEPFMKKLKHLFTHRTEISPEVGLIMENIVSYLWENDLLSDSEKDSFYNNSKN